MKRLNEDKSWGVEKYSKFLNEGNEEAFGDKIDPAWEDEDKRKKDVLKRGQELSNLFVKFSEEFDPSWWSLDDITMEDLEPLEEIAEKMCAVFPDLKSIVDK